MNSEIKTRLHALEDQLIANGYAEDDQMTELVDLVKQYMDATLGGALSPKSGNHVYHGMLINPAALAHKVVEYEESAIRKIDAMVGIG